MRKVLFVTYGGGHVAMTVPVVQELRRRGGWEISVLGLTTARPALEAAGIPCLGFRDLVLPGEDKDALSLGEEFASRYHTEGVGVSIEESVAYLGLSYADLERRLGVEEATRRFAERGRQALLPLGPLERLIRREVPDVVVATSSPRAEEAAIRTAQRLGIPSLCMNDLFALDQDNAFLWERDYADGMTVLSTWVRDLLVSRGRCSEDVFVTGNPAFDRLAKPNLPARAFEWRRENGCVGRKVITWASQPEPGRPDLPRRICSALLDALPGHRDWRLVYRPHPSESPLADPLPAGAILSRRSDDLAVLLEASDVVVVLTTTVGLEAALLDRPVVKLCLSAYDYTAPYEEMGIALPVKRLEDLSEALERVLAGGPEATRLAEGRHRLEPPAGAAGRVANVLEAMPGASPDRARSAHLRHRNA